MTITNSELYKQYLFFRRECKKTFSQTIFHLSLHHNLAEQAIIRRLIRAEENNGE